MVKIFRAWQADCSRRADWFASGALHNTEIGVCDGHFCPFDSFGLTKGKNSRFAEILTVTAAIAECRVKFREPGDFFAG